MLRYIANDTRGFKAFVANIVHKKKKINAEHWKYVSLKENPADDTSKGMNFKKLVNVDTRFQGPKFLWKPQSP